MLFTLKNPAEPMIAAAFDPGDMHMLWNAGSHISPFHCDR